MTAFSARSIAHVALALTIATGTGQCVLGQETNAPPTTPPPTPPPVSAPAATKPQADLPKAIDLVNASMEALGGKAKFDAIKTITVVGELPTPVGTLKMDMKSDKMGQFALEQFLDGKLIASMGSDGKVAWKHNPVAGYVVLDESESRQVIRDSNMFRMLFNITEEFKTLETVEKVDFNGMECYKVRMTPRDEHTAEHAGFFSVEDKKLQGFEFYQEGPMGKVPVIVKLMDWKPVEGLTLFHKMIAEQMGMPMEMTITEVAFNNVDPKAFALPEGVTQMIQDQTAPAVAPTGGDSPTTAPVQPKPQ